MLVSGLIKDAITPASNVSFHKIYGIFCVNKGETITCWNDFGRETLKTAPQELTVQWKDTSGTTWYDYVKISTSMAFSLTFFDEELLNYDQVLNIVCSLSPYTTDYTDSTIMYHTMNNTADLTALVDEDGTFTINPSNEDEAFIDLDAGSALDPDIELGDHVVGIDDEGVLYNLGYITDIGESPSYQTLTVASFETNADSFTGGTIRVFSTKYARVGLWFRREIACQTEALPLTDLDVSWLWFGSNS
jgi:hypothetical protein